jgi:hypothetical protein
MKQLTMYALILVLAIFSGCEHEKEHDHDDHTHNDGAVLTLDNCESSFGLGVDPFYSTYFSCVDVVASGNNTVITSDNFPPYESWYYNTADENYIEFVSQGTGYYLNPNTISSQDLTISIVDNPITKGLTINDALVDGIVGTNSDEYSMGAVGVALNGVAIFNPLAAPGDDIEDEKFSFDFYSGHPTNMGYYHYHSSTKGPLEVLSHKGLIQTPTVGSGEIELYGMMCDGTLILGCTELDGSVSSNSDFDAQNGHIHDITDGTNIFFLNRYHTHICTDTYTGHKFTPEIQYYEGCN